MSSKLKGLGKYWTLMPFVLLIVMIELTPLGNIIRQSLISEEGVFGLDNYVAIFSKAIYRKTISNSLRLTFSASLIGLLLAFLGGMAVSTAKAKTQNTFISLLNMASNFCGIPLAFAFMIVMGSTGVLTLSAKSLGWNWLANFDLYTLKGILLVYVYFSIPIGTLMIIPSFNGIKKEWKEAAQLMNASGFQFWWKIGIPVLIPGITGTFSIIFANALAAYATIYALVQNNFPVLPTKIADCFTGDIIGRPEIGSALTVVLLLIMCVVLILGNLVKKYAVKGGVQK